MNIEAAERLWGLSQHLRAIPQDDGAFEIGHWSCGTTACAIGRGIIDGLLPGLKLAPGSFSMVPVYKDRESYGAVAAYFGITEIAAITLFGPGAYIYRTDLPGRSITPACVANAIDAFLLASLLKGSPLLAEMYEEE